MTVWSGPGNRPRGARSGDLGQGVGTGAAGPMTASNTTPQIPSRDDPGTTVPVVHGSARAGLPLGAMSRDTKLGEGVTKPCARAGDGGRRAAARGHARACSRSSYPVQPWVRAGHRPRPSPARPGPPRRAAHGPGVDGHLDRDQGRDRTGPAVPPLRRSRRAPPRVGQGAVPPAAPRSAPWCRRGPRPCGVRCPRTVGAHR